MTEFTMHDFGACKTDDAACQLPASDQLITIDLPVGLGPKAKNLPADVLTIQKALNRIPLKDGGPDKPVPETGTLTNKQSDPTITAIQKFQIKHFGWPGADGRVDPAPGATLARINQLLFAQTPLDPAAEAALVAKLTANVGLASMYVFNAVMNLRFANGDIAVLPPDKQRAIDRLERHFRLDQSAASARPKVIREISEVYNRMASVLVRGAEFFVMDSTMPFIAIATDRGILRTGKKTLDGQPQDKIRLGKRIVLEVDNPEFCAFLIVHEMTHFIGFRNQSEQIKDAGRGWFDDPGIKKLSQFERLRNADSYATHAAECRFNSPLRPSFIKAGGSGLGGAR